MYKAGDLHLVIRCGHNDERCADESTCDRTGQLRQVYDDGCPAENREPVTSVVLLPHSCGEWVIGGPAEIRALIADLEAAAKTLEGRT